MMSESGRYCCKSRKSTDAENLAKADFLADSAAAIISSADAKLRRRFGAKRCGPHIAAGETHQRSWKDLAVTPKRLLQQYLHV
jgi:hypothetical protein